MQGMPDILGLLSKLGGSGGGLGGLGGLGSLAGLAGLGGLGGLAGKDGAKNPLDTLSMIGNLSKLGKGGDINDILGMFANAAGNSEQTSNEETDEEPMYEAKPKEESSSSTYPCDSCHVHCDRARLGLPTYKEVRHMAANWRRY